MEEKANNKYTFTFKEYECECTFITTIDGIVTKLMLRKERIMMRFENFKDFINKDYSSTQVGVKIGTSPLEPVYAHRIDGLIQIGCITMTQQEFNKFYNLIKFKKNEYIRQSSC